MRSLFLVALVLSYKAVFGQEMPLPKKVKADINPWAQTVTFNGSDSYFDNNQTFPQTNLRWDSRTGSGMMNGCEWLQSSWIGATPKLCSVETMGTISAVFQWRGKGKAPDAVEVCIDSALYARSAGGVTPSLLLVNGLGSSTKSLASGNARESVAQGSKTVVLPVVNGIAKCSLGVSGRVSAMTSGLVALRMDVKFKVR